MKEGGLVRNNIGFFHDLTVTKPVIQGVRAVLERRVVTGSQMTI